MPKLQSDYLQQHQELHTFTLILRLEQILLTTRTGTTTSPLLTSLEQNIIYSVNFLVVKK